MEKRLFIEIMAILLERVKTGGIKRGVKLLKFITQHPEEAAAQFVNWLNNGLRICDTSELRTVKLRLEKNPINNAAEALVKEGLMCPHAYEMAKKSAPSMSSEKMTVEAISISLADLGLIKPSSLREIYIQAGKFGFGLCPPEVVIQLYLHYPEQLHGGSDDEWNSEQMIAVTPLTDPNGNLSIFQIGKDHEGIRRITTAWASNWSYNLVERFVFVTKK